MQKSEAEDLRDRISDLNDKCFSQRQIAKALKIPLSNVNYHLSIIRKQNLRDYDRMMDPDGRNREFHPAMKRQIEKAIQTAWINEARAEKRLEEEIALGKTPTAFGHVNASLQVIRGLLNDLRSHIGVVTPKPDQVWMRQQYERLQQQQEKLEEKIQTRKIIGVSSFENTP